MGNHRRLGNAGGSLKSFSLPHRDDLTSAPGIFHTAVVATT